MLIGDLAELTGASTRSLRHYETLGLIQAVRSQNGYRHYSEENVERVRTIRFLLASGLKTSTIAEIMPAMMYQHCKLADPAVRSAIEREVDRIKAQIDQLAESHRILSEALRKGEIRRSARRPE
jgi:DNA-binding transcriptional MerR regulator